MRPDQCGFGRSLESLAPGDRAAVEGFAAWLAGRVALTADERDWVSFSDPRAAIRGVRWTFRCNEHAVMCRTIEPWEHEILGGVA